MPTGKLPDPMPTAELLALPPVIDRATAARALRMTYLMACKQVKSGSFPLKPLPHSGRQGVYALADLLRYLGFDPGAATSAVAAEQFRPGTGTAA